MNKKYTESLRTKFINKIASIFSNAELKNIAKIAKINTQSI